MYISPFVAPAHCCIGCRIGGSTCRDRDEPLQIQQLRRNDEEVLLRQPNDAGKMVLMCEDCLDVVAQLGSNSASQASTLWSASAAQRWVIWNASDIKAQA